MKNSLLANFDGPIVMIGFGSIGKGTLPLLERHIAFDRSKFVVIAPDDRNCHLLEERQIKFLRQAITRDNYRAVLSPLLTGGPGRGMVVNLSVDTSSVDLMELAKDLNAFYIDTVVEPWPGLYTDQGRSISERSNYALREGVLELRRRRPGGVTAVSCCGANPGMVSWMVKQALIDVASDLKLDFIEPQSREQWARLMRRAGVKGIHIAERDTQRANAPKRRGAFINTWSVEGFISEGLQPSELGWGTHEKSLPPRRIPARFRLRLGDLPDASRRGHPRPLVDADCTGPARLDDHAQRVDFNSRLLHSVRGWQSRLSANMPLCLPPMRRCRAVAARNG
jgi:homospermidine synthase